MNFDLIFFSIFALFVATFAWRFFSSGSLTGALLGGRIRRELGVISLKEGGFTSQNLKVMAMEAKSGEQFIALSIVSKAPLGASMVPFKLSKSQAQELVRILQQGILA